MSNSQPPTHTAICQRSGNSTPPLTFSAATVWQLGDVGRDPPRLVAPRAGAGRRPSVVLVFELSRSLISGLLALDLPKPVRYAAVPAFSLWTSDQSTCGSVLRNSTTFTLKRLSGWASMIPHAATQFGSVGPPDFNSVKTIAHPRGVESHGEPIPSTSPGRLSFQSSSV